MANRLPVPATQLPPATPEEQADWDIEDRRAEVFLRLSTGATQAEVADYLGVSRSTIQKDWKAALAARRSRRDTVEDEVERLAATYEAVIAAAWQRSNKADPASVAASNNLRLVMDAAEKRGKLLGVGESPEANDNGTVEVVVNVGGGEGPSPDVQVGVRSS